MTMSFKSPHELQQMIEALQRRVSLLESEVAANVGALERRVGQLEQAAQAVKRATANKSGVRS